MIKNTSRLVESGFVSEFKHRINTDGDRYDIAEWLESAQSSLRSLNPDFTVAWNNLVNRFNRLDVNDVEALSDYLEDLTMFRSNINNLVNQLNGLTNDINQAMRATTKATTRANRR